MINRHLSALSTVPPRRFSPLMNECDGSGNTNIVARPSWSLMRFHPYWPEFFEPKDSKIWSVEVQEDNAVQLSIYAPAIFAGDIKLEMLEQRHYRYLGDVFY